MKIYVAGKFEEAERVRRVHKLLRSRNFAITHDWTTEDASIYEGEAKATYKRQCAMNDYLGVVNADAVLVINHALLYGGAAEMGMAIALHKPVLVVGSEIRENIFFHLGAPYVRICTSLSDAIRQLVIMRGHQ